MAEARESQGEKLAAGTDVAGYIVESELGHGGMGVVYRATHPVIGKRVAIKVLHQDIAEHKDALERFTQEARAVNQIRHPNIVDIFGFGTMPDGRAYLMMDLLDGEPLRKRIKRGPLHVSEAASIVDETASALHAVHDKGFIHRDLKPDNVFLVPRDGSWPAVKLLDFGLAKLQPHAGKTPFRTATGVVLGTPDYMAPELVRQRGEIDHRVDLYALGVMTFEMITGRRPFVGHDGSLQKLQQIVETPAPPLRELAPHVPDELARLVDALLAKAPAERPSLGEVRGVIKRLRSADELPSMSVVAMEAAGTTLTDAPLPVMATPPTGVMSLARETVREPAAPRISSPALVAPGASPASLPTEPLLPSQPIPSARAPARPSGAPSMSGLGPAASHGGTVLGVAPPPAPPRPSASVRIAQAKPARLNPAYVVLAVLAVLAAAIAVIALAMR